ncbi:MAG: glycosyltransferase [bacterium]
MKKILILNTTFSKGGAAQVARDLFFHFKKESDFSMYFAYGRGGKNSESNTFYFGNKIELFIHIFFVRFLGLEGFGSYFSTKKLVNFIEKEKFDAVHIHNLHGYYVNFFSLLKYLNEKNIKVIWTLHDEWIFTWLPAHSMGCNHCKTLDGKCVNKYKYPKNFFPIFSKFMLSRKKNILKYKNIMFISPAQWLYNEAVDEFKLSNINLITNGVDNNIFIPSTDKTLLRNKYKLPEDKKIILLSANNFKDKNKGGHFIKDILRNLDKNKYTLCVIGSKIDSEEGLIAFDYISDRSMLSEIYSLSDIYCFLSAVETSPLSIIEAMSCGLPIAGFKIKALEGLCDEENSILVEYGNIERLLESINKITENNSLQNSMGKHSRYLAINNFNQDSTYKSYKAAYETNLNK